MPRKPQRDAPSKAGEVNESLEVDNPKVAYRGALLASLEKHATSNGRLLTILDTEWSRDFHESLCRLHLTHLNLGLYMLRHGGASYQVQSNFRSLPAAIFRGRWKSMTSARRYIMPGALNQVWQRLSPEHQQWAHRCERAIGDVLSGRSPPLSNPWVAQ